MTSTAAVTSFAEPMQRRLSLVLWPHEPLMRHEFTFFRSVPDAEGFHHYNEMLACPVCHRVWAVFQVSNHQFTYATTAPCESCSVDELMRDRQVPGSLLERGIHQRLDWDLLKHLPPPLLKRELNLTLKYFHLQPFFEDNFYERTPVQIQSPHTAAPSSIRLGAEPTRRR